MPGRLLGVTVRISMTRTVITSMLCFVLGAWYAWQLGAHVRWRERECMKAKADAADKLDDAEVYLHAAQYRLGWAEVVLRDEQARCEWWARACR